MFIHCPECGRPMWRDTLRVWWLNLTGRRSRLAATAGFQADLAKYIHKDVLLVAQRTLRPPYTGKK